MSEIYGLDALRKLREEQAAAEPPRQASLLADISPDVPMDDATITVWNGERFVAFDDKWIASRPVATEDRREVTAKQADTKKADTKDARAEESAQEEMWNE